MNSMIRQLILSLLSFVIICDAFEVPDVTLEVLRPKGFRISIPAEVGIKLFSFHGKINEEMNGREAGAFQKDITKAKNGRWSYYNPSTTLNVGDTLYYWTYVDYFDGRNKLGYSREDQVLQVSDHHIQKPATSVQPIPVVCVTRRTRGNVRRKRTLECDESITTYNEGIKPCKNELIFSDNFTKLDDSKWTKERRFADEPDYEFVLYLDEHTHILNVSKGFLSITPFPTHGNIVSSDQESNLGPTCTGKRGTTECVQTAAGYIILPPVLSGQITTKHSFSFLYGKIEIEAKMPEGDWIYPELYLNPKNEEYGRGYQSGQIRIAFIPGNSNFSEVLYGGCILGASNAGRGYAMKSVRRKTGWTNKFHRFGVEWTNEKISLSVDDSVYGTIFPPEGGFASLENKLNLKGCDRWRNSPSKMAPFDKEMFITIGVGVGGRNFPDEGISTRFGEIDTKPWQNYDPKGQKKFFKAQSEWYKTWNDQKSVLEVRHVKVFAL